MFTVSKNICNALILAFIFIQTNQTLQMSLVSRQAALAGTPLGKDELKSLQTKMKSSSQLSVDFTQTTTNPIRPNQKKISTGAASFAKPAKFRWAIQKPKADTLIFDGDTLYSLQDDAKTATSYNAKADRAIEIREVIDLVLDFDVLLKRYEITESSKDERLAHLSLKPHNKNVIDHLEVDVSLATASIERVKMFFSNKNTNELVFSSPDRSPIPANTFQVPAGYKTVSGLQ